MVLCDNVHRDPATNKSYVLGTFSQLGARKFPAPIRLCVYWAITDALGDVELAFRLIDAKNIVDESVEPAFEYSFFATSPTPLAVIEGSFQIQAAIPCQGVYHCEMFADQQLLMSRRLVAVELPVKKDNDDETS